MHTQEIRAAGLEALHLGTELLQRMRLADSFAGVFEAADLQWSWRRPRLSDSMEQIFWTDNHGPVAGLYLTAVGENRFQLDPILVPGFDPEIVWNRLKHHVDAFPEASFDIPVSDDDNVLTALARDSGFVANDTDSTGWMDAADCPDPVEFYAGLSLIDRSTHAHLPNPLQERNGPDIDERLTQCSLYDPSLNLAILHESGEIAGYSLYWMDPVTKVGLVEPVRVHDAYQRQGLARAMVSQGLNRLKANGAERIKVSWETEAAGALYIGLGFQRQSTTSWYRTGESSESTG